MKTKAIGYLEVAQTLISKQEEISCTVSVHCSYYAVFMYMKYILAHTDRQQLSYEEQDKQSKEEGSHKYMIEQIKQRISQTKKGQEFAQFVLFLKKKRVEADYSIRQFTMEESLELKQLAEGLIAKLKMYFGNL